MDATTIEQARATLPRNTIYADWAASALPIPPPNPPSFIPPAHTPHHPILLAARHALQTHLNDTHAAYHIIFTSGATAAFHLLASRLPFSPNSTLITHTHVHNAVVGIRNPALHAGATFRSVDSQTLERELNLGYTANGKTEAKQNTLPNEKAPHFTLLAYPAECNLTGTQYPLQWCRLAKRNGLPNAHPGSVITVVDTAKYLASSTLNLDAQADIDCLVFSLYKLCGTYTGLGALLIRKQSLLAGLLDGTGGMAYFGGGESVSVMTPFSNKLFVAGGLERGLELGTPNMQAIDGMKWVLGKFSGKMEEVYANGVEVGDVFRRGMKECFGDGVVVYGDGQGSVVAFSLFREGGDGVGHTEVGRVLEVGGVFARVGCMCNVGGCAQVLGLTDEDIMENWRRGIRCGKGGDFVKGKGTGLVRVSFGWGSKVEDAVGVVKILKEGICFNVGRKIGYGKENVGGCRVSQLWVYGVKGCGGSRMERTGVVDGGFAMDREFGVEVGGEVVGVREFHELCGICTGWKDRELEMWMEAEQNQIICGKGEMEKWLSDVLERKAELVKLDKMRKNGDVLVVWEGELEEVSRDCGMSRDRLIRSLRPNIVVEGGRNWEGGDVLVGKEVRLVKRRECRRCGIVNLIAGWGGEVEKGEPLRSIIRFGRRIGRGGVVFGVLYRIEGVGEGGRGEIRVGEVLKMEKL